MARRRTSRNIRGPAGSSGEIDWIAAQKQVGFADVELQSVAAYSQRNVVDTVDEMLQQRSNFARSAEAADLTIVVKEMW